MFDTLYDPRLQVPGSQNCGEDIKSSVAARDIFGMQAFSRRRSISSADCSPVPSRDPTTLGTSPRSSAGLLLKLTKRHNAWCEPAPFSTIH